MPDEATRAAISDWIMKGHSWTQFLGPLVPDPDVSRSSPTNRGGASGRPRRLKSDIAYIRRSLWEIVREQQPMTVRQVFYQAVSRGVVEKKESEYKGTVGRLLKEMRLDDELAWDWIADNTRWMRKPTSFNGTEEALQRTAKLYRRDLWADADAYVEIWLEKEALAGVLVDVTDVYDVPLMVSRGYSSLSYLHSAAETITAKDKPAYLYYFGDHDPSGVDIPRNIQARLEEFAPWADVTFEVVAVTPEQIDQYSLPTRPTKKSDTRSKKFSGESVELDAIAPDDLRALCQSCIDRHSDQDRLAILKVAEESERSILMGMAGMS